MMAAPIAVYVQTGMESEIGPDGSPGKHQLTGVVTAGVEEPLGTAVEVGVPVAAVEIGVEIGTAGTAAAAVELGGSTCELSDEDTAPGTGKLDVVEVVSAIPVAISAGDVAGDELTACATCAGGAEGTAA